MRLYGIQRRENNRKTWTETFPFGYVHTANLTWFAPDFQPSRQSNACMHTAVFLLDLNPLYNVCLDFPSRQPQQQYNNLCAPEGKREAETSERVQKALWWTYVRTHPTVGSSVGSYSARTVLLSCFPRHPRQSTNKIIFKMHVSGGNLDTKELWRWHNHRHVSNTRNDKAESSGYRIM